MKLFNSSLTKLMNQRDKDKGRKRKYEEQKNQEISQQDKVDKLSKMMNLSSGLLVVDNFFCVSDEDVERRAEVLDEVKQNERSNKELRALESMKKDDDRFQTMVTAIIESLPFQKRRGDSFSGKAK